MDPDGAHPPGLVHRALVHHGEDELLAHLAEYAREGIQAGEPTMVLASRRRLSALRRALGPDAPVRWVPNDLASIRLGVAFDDVRRQVAAHSGRGRLRVAADWDLTTMTGSERRAFMRWEAAATAILADEHATVLCCHDGADPVVTAGARATHPQVWTDGAWAADPAYTLPAAHLRACAAPAPPDAGPLPLDDPWDLAPIRERIGRAGVAAGMDAGVLADFEIAANEVAANALWHARGPREARVAVVGRALVCEVRDGGPGLDPLAAHIPPPPGGRAGQGLWIAHQLADVVQIIPDGAGTRVRLEATLPAPGGPGGPAGRGRAPGSTSPP
ncbi:MAG TPA: MEDS domain-containing protein [Miltoncostaeaceae bacterium]|nr:MEDS domain-containing protein [Miltoncostaeaceae bacterium]